jgi:hypothetical protein
LVITSHDVEIIVVNFASSSFFDEVGIDAPPSSSMDSTASPEVKTTEGKRVGVCSLAHSTSRVEGRAGVLGWD